MGRHAANAVRLQLIAHLMFLLCLVSLGFVDRGAVAQELVGQAPRRLPGNDCHPWWELQYGLAGERAGPDFQ